MAAWHGSGSAPPPREMVAGAAANPGNRTSRARLGAAARSSRVDLFAGGRQTREWDCGIKKRTSFFLGRDELMKDGVVT